MIISCYGDSNTRYYLGDRAAGGPEADSYPANLVRRYEAAGEAGVGVFNRGFPDMGIEFGLHHFDDNVTGLRADVCVLGFGTNDIRRPGADLDAFLRDFEELIRLCQAANVRTAALLIPWFAEDYCGAEGQARIPVWNAALSALCARYGVKVFDTYTPFAADPDRYFNEKLTPKRHYSPAATSAIAGMVFDWLK